jgi:hypothetical protein
MRRSPGRRGQRQYMTKGHPRHRRPHYDYEQVQQRIHLHNVRSGADTRTGWAQLSHSTFLIASSSMRVTDCTVDPPCICPEPRTYRYSAGSPITRRWRPPSCENSSRRRPFQGDVGFLESARVQVVFHAACTALAQGSGEEDRPTPQRHGSETKRHELQGQCVRCKGEKITSFLSGFFRCHSRSSPYLSFSSTLPPFH